MKIVTLFFVLSLITSLSAGQTQLEMDAEASQKYTKADQELNITYQKILQEYKADTAFIRNLKISQRIWIQFRDAEMKVMYPDRPQFYYGSVLPMCWSMYLAQVTAERIKTLKVWLDGVDEGDVCSCSVKIKK
jgi:uncharacterized protein YecT (DUF1311 family)